MNACLYKTFDFPCDGMGIVDRLREESCLFFLDSSQSRASRARYSFIGFDPFEIFEGRGPGLLNDLREKFQNFKAAPSRTKFPLMAGIVGWIAYDYGFHLEKIKLQNREDTGLPDGVFGFYDGVIVIDHLEKKMHITSSGFPEKNSTLRALRAKERLRTMVKKLALDEFPKDRESKGRQGISLPEKISSALTSSSLNKNLKSSLSRGKYFAAVERALDYIRRGEIYQVNLAQRFDIPWPSKARPLDIYRALRALSPSSFGAFWQGGPWTVMSASPERFLSLRGQAVQTQPMKGTRPRGQNQREDNIERQGLLNSRKDQAELLMITDLERNDLGKVCQYGSIHVKKLRVLEKYRTVFQTTSTVEGVLRPDKDAFDLLRSCFPGGSITGCPKIRAMEIIEELEPVRRGIYTGVLGYIDFSGEMDFNILIRTLFGSQGKISFHVGAGIVADSVPETEYEETLVKARALRQALAVVRKN